MVGPYHELNLYPATSIILAPVRIIGFLVQGSYLRYPGEPMLDSVEVSRSVWTSMFGSSVMIGIGLLRLIGLGEG